MEESDAPKIMWPGSLWRIALSTLVIVCLFRYLFFGGWPSDWLVRREQRKIVDNRVQTAGGWTALRRACNALVTGTNRDIGIQWYRFDTNAFPPVIAALHSSEVRFDAPKAVRGSIFETEFLVVHIKIFGMHRTGGRAYPYFGLEFVFGTNADRYTPRPSLGGASGNCYDSYRKVADGIYEIYGPS